MSDIIDIEEKRKKKDEEKKKKEYESKSPKTIDDLKDENGEDLDQLF